MQETNISRLQRVRREKSPSERTPVRDGPVKSKAPTPAKEDDAGVHSGSEEGEIEED